ncbi:MAG: hypothetical protein Q8K63_05655 [Acidimicrobiales bacterium]|nr:hypothetical protein [Acidimicrobiales bacterium]
MAERSASERYFGAFEFEFNRERAAVLTRYGQKVDAAIAKCQALLDHIDESDPSGVEAYKASRRAALQAVDDLCFQRETLGVFDNARVHQFYRVPRPLEEPPPTAD